jgi:uncharacterized protein YoxC
MTTESKENFSISEDERVREQQFRRAVSSFEGIMLSQIEMKNKLGDRLNLSIVTGISILGLIALSILILLFTLTTQINRMNAVVDEMNVNFIQVADQMSAMRGYVDSMEQRVALLNVISDQTSIMQGEMEVIASDVNLIHGRVNSVGLNIHGVRNKVDNISGTVNRMDYSVDNMSSDMRDMARPSRMFNSFVPFF